VVVEMNQNQNGLATFNVGVQYWVLSELDL